MVAGGEALAHEEGGRVVLVAGALPGETVDAELVEERAGYARARLVAVVEPVPERTVPPCPHVARGCGGCGWQHISPAAQRRFKASVVCDSLRRLGGLGDPKVVLGPELPAFGYRTVLRLAVARRAGFRRYRGSEVVEVDSCLVAHPMLAELLVEGDFGEACGAVVRCGARTGERLAVLSPSASGARLPPEVHVVGEDELAAGRRAWLSERVAGVRLRVSAQSFFQASPEGSEALADLVATAVAGAPAGRFVDAYGGVGLFAATAGRHRPVTLLESSASSVADARVNLPGAKVLRVDVGRWSPSPAAVVVADPPRAGLGRRAVAALGGTGASHLALVACDAASLGRDAALLTAEGFRLESTTVVDMFPGTPHVETVSRFVR
jgi:23S rRNA (uracil1939-C5)-methyltransferase